MTGEQKAVLDLMIFIPSVEDVFGRGGVDKQKKIPARIMRGVDKKHWVRHMLKVDQMSAKKRREYNV